MEKIIKEGKITKAELARMIGISSERVTQFMNLLRLCPEVKKKILKEGKEIRISERKLRGLIGISKKKQIMGIKAMLNYRKK